MLMQKILTVFDSALSAGHVVWTKTTLQRVSAAGIAFQVRLIPALAKKPVGDPAASKPAQQNGIEKPIDKRPAPVNPFLPYDPQLCVDVYEHHNLLLNKFSLVKGHVLLTTKEFCSQLAPLDEKDFAAAWQTMSSPGMPRYLCFYNCGIKSGASQPHKHCQLLPQSTEDEGQPFPPVEAILKSSLESNIALGVPFVYPGFKFAHSIAVLPPLPADPKAAGVILENIYRETLTKAFELAQLDWSQCLSRTGERASQPSYNMIFDGNLMMVVPRKEDAAHGISLNSVAFAGMLLVKSEEQLALVTELGPLTLLAEVGYPITSQLH